ncbi:uncharacterized protein JCM15063_002286 [Sporobolomyces koalae]|uniref:uncharacterized protein n=1 Tax=Sporobolomyces koalae TaxID=500713 RepID=UPI0031701788
MQRFRRSRSESKKRNNKSASAAAGSTTTSTSSPSTSRRGSSSTTHTNHRQQDEDVDDASLHGGPMVRSGSTLSLPEPEQFRTSLILPHLAARFELLRGDDGQLVDYDTIHTHLDEQRRTGRLTMHEMETVLQQYKIQSAFEQQQQPLPTSSQTGQKQKKKRIDWTGVDLEQLAKATNSHSGSIPRIEVPPPLPTTSPVLALRQLSPPAPSSTTFPNERTSLMSTASLNPSSSSINSFVSFLPSSPEISKAQPTSASVALEERQGSASSTRSNPMSVSSRSSSSPHSSPGSRRMRNHGDGRTLFGGGSVGMSKSLSGNSLDSQASWNSTSRKKPPQRPPPLPPQQDDLDKASSESTESHERTVGADEGEQDGIERKDEELTESQVKRISMVLDDVRDHLGLGSLRSKLPLGQDRLDEEGDDESEHLSANDKQSLVEDDEPSEAEEKVPDAASIRSTVSAVTEASLGGEEQYDAPRRVPLPPSIASSQSVRSMCPDSPPTPSAPSHPALPLSASSASISHTSRSRQYTSETDTTETPSTPNGTVVPKAFSFPFVPPRDLFAQERDEGDELPDEIYPDDSRGFAEEGEEDEEDLTMVASSIALPSSDEEDDAESARMPESSELLPQDYQEVEKAGMRDSVQSDMSLATGGGSSFHEDSDASASSQEQEDVWEVADAPGSEDSARTSGAFKDTSLPSPTSPPQPPSEPQHDRELERPQDGVEKLDVPALSSAQLDRLPSEELLAMIATAGSNSNTVGDLVLEDLVLIQQALVKRAEEKKRRALGTDQTDVGINEEEDEEMAPKVMGIEEDDSEEEMEQDAVESLRDEQDFDAGGYYRNDDDADTGSDSHSMRDGEEQAEDVETSSMETGGGFGSRKDSIESGVTSTGAFDFGDELAGLGFSSLPLPSPSISMTTPNKRSSKRASNRASVRSNVTKDSTTRIKRIDTTMLLGPESSKMELQTSQASSSPGFTNSVITPSTSQSDAFEFSSLAGSPDALDWSEHREAQMQGSPYGSDDAQAKSDGFSPDIGVTRSPAMQDLAAEHYEPTEVDELQAETSQGGVESANQVSESPGRPATGGDPSESVSTLGAPVELDANPPTRVARNMPRRDPTTSMLIRDVRNQATLATIALKKTPISPPTRPLSKRSIRKGSISSPHLVSAPADMATVPIVPSVPTNIMLAQTSPSARSPRGPLKAAKSKSNRKEPVENDGSKSKGLSQRFKMLLKKQSRDHLPLNGDEVTPFVDFDSTEAADHVAPPSSSEPPPITPPNQDTARFASPGSSEFPQTPDDDPKTPLAQRKSAPSAVRSPSHRPAAPSLAVVEELVERGSPPLPSQLSASAPPLASPVPSYSSGKEGRGLNRFVSRLRKSPVPPPISSPQLSNSDDKDTVSSYRTSSRGYEDTPTGLGIDAVRSSRIPLSAESSPRLDRDQAVFPPVPSTAPLSVGRNSQASFAVQQVSHGPVEYSSSAGGRVSLESSRVSRTSGHPVRSSTGSMQRLWEAAEDLGLPPDKVRELVDSAYAQSPTTSHGRSNSDKSVSVSSPRRRYSNASSSRRGRSASDTSVGGSRHGRKNSASSSRSIQGRSPTPPPGSRHLRKASITSIREAEAIPELPATYSSSSLPPSSSANSRLSVTGAQYPPPASPSLGSIISSRRSGYADSFLDFYAQASDDYDEADVPPVPPINGRFASDRSLASNLDGFEDLTLGARSAELGEEEEYRGGEPDETEGGEVVWQVLSDLRNNRLSTISKNSSFGFDSRDSSFEVDDPTPHETASKDRSESIANMLRHRDRKRSSAQMPPFQAGRFPSIYVRDEQKLLDLSHQGGVAEEPHGRFFVRPKSHDHDETLNAAESTMPPLPEHYQQLIASAGSSSLRTQFDPSSLPRSSDSFHPERPDPRYEDA